MSATITTSLFIILPTILLPVTEVAQADAPNGYTLTWSDEFNGSKVDTNTWNYRTDAKADSIQQADNVIESADNMVIRLRKLVSPITVDGKTFYYSGGGLVSQQKFRYGYYETRARVSPDSGWHVAFWAMRGDGTTTFPPERRTEIDGFEIDTNNNIMNPYHTLVNWYADGSSRIDRCPDSNALNPTDGFHVYGFEWTETNIKYYIDGALRCTLSYLPTDNEHDRINIWLTAIAINDTEFSGPIDDTKLPSEVKFDYVRFYERDVYINSGEPGYSEKGSGWDTSVLQGYSFSTSRYSCQPGASARWTPNIPAPGNYKVYVYKIAAKNDNDSRSQLDIIANGTTTTKLVDYTSGANNEWLDVGTYYFPAGTDGYVENTHSNNFNTCTRASMVKFVRQ